MLEFEIPGGEPCLWPVFGESSESEFEWEIQGNKEHFRELGKNYP